MLDFWELNSLSQETIVLSKLKVGELPHPYCLLTFLAVNKFCIYILSQVLAL